MDKVWFLNRSLKQTLVFELYTDYHRLVTYHFANDDIPDDLIRRMELYVKVGRNVYDSASYKLKQEYFRGFLKSSEAIDIKYFRSFKGFKLGDSKAKAIEAYGMPDKDESANREPSKGEVEKCEWGFYGDNDIPDVLSGNLKSSQNKPFAKDSFGYHVTMYFRAGRLIGMILNNDIP